MQTRRAFITTAGASVLVALTGYAGASGTTEAQDNGGPMEIMIGWSGGDGAKAFEALHEGFKQEYPDVETTINNNPGGAGTGLATALDTRMFNRNPPSTWGFFPGPELTDFAEAGLLGDITQEVWEKEGLGEVVPDYLQQLSRFEDIGFVAVPIEFNRLNNLFYNTNVVEQAGVDPAGISSPSDLLSAMEQVESQTDAVGMAQSTQSPWTVLQLWEAVYLGENGFDSYTSMLNGNIQEHESEIKNTLQLVADYRQFFNEDAGSINFSEAISTFIAEDAAFLHQGDWAVGNMTRAEDYAYESDWLATPFPGSDNVFMGQNSAFMFPSPNPTPESTIKWLRYVGSVEAQIRFNSIKGGIPCRNDAPMDDDQWQFNAHQQSQYQDFLNAENLIGTIAHNNVVVPQIASSVSTVFSRFTANWDVDSTFNGLVEAFNA